MSKIRVAINGLGRIGKAAARIILSNHPDLELVAINSLFSPKDTAYTLKYDTIYRRFEYDLDILENEIMVKRPQGNQKILILKEMDPEKLPWKELEIDLVLECTGVFRDKDKASKHLRAGAKKVIISAPVKDSEIPTIVQGVNESEAIKKMLETEINMISNASCTTNCVAPALKVMTDNFGVDFVAGITVHAYTASQALVDMLGKSDMRDNRAGAENSIPSSTGAASAVILVLPELKNKVMLTSIRVPVPTGSMVYLTLQMDKEYTVEEINAKFKEASNTNLKGILAYTEDEIVSADIIEDTHSSIVDGKLTEVLGKNAKITLWYDNEWGYANRLVELVKKVF